MNSATTKNRETIDLAVNAIFRTSPTYQKLVAAVVTGQVAGLIMAVIVILVFTIFLGYQPLYPVQVIGSAIFGESALNCVHLNAVIAGLLLHQLGPSILWGVVFGLISLRVPTYTTKQALGLGLFVGVISMIGPYLLIPFAMKTLHGVDFWNREVPLFWDWAAHIVFGLSFGFYPMIEKALSKSRTN